METSQFFACFEIQNNDFRLRNNRNTCSGNEKFVTQDRKSLFSHDARRPLIHDRTVFGVHLIDRVGKLVDRIECVTAVVTGKAREGDIRGHVHGSHVAQVSCVVDIDVLDCKIPVVEVDHKQFTIGIAQSRYGIRDFFRNKRTDVGPVERIQLINRRISGSQKRSGIVPEAGAVKGKVEGRFIACCVARCIVRIEDGSRNGINGMNDR